MMTNHNYDTQCKNGIRFFLVLYCIFLSANQVQLAADRKFEIVKQAPYKYGCGFAAILNALQFGNRQNQNALHLLKGRTGAERIKELMQVYGQRPFVDYKLGNRLRPDGISCNDLRDAFNDLRKDAHLSALEGIYLDRPLKSTNKDFLSNIHKKLSYSLSAGELPLICLRSQVAAYNETKKDFFWQSLDLHEVTATAISPIFYDGFDLTYLDPGTGAQHTLFVYCDVRNFAALRGTTWLSERPFLSVSGSNVDLYTSKMPWFGRTITYLNFAILKHEPAAPNK